MIEKFKTLFFVKCSLISLYLALTIPIPFISTDELKIISLIAFLLGLFLIIDITNDYVITCEKKISYKTSFSSKIFGKESWEISWKEIKSIESLPTSQGGRIYYFKTNNNEKFIVPQRIDNYKRFLSIISEKINLEIHQISYISPLWTYKILTFLSLFMIVGELVAFSV